MTLTRFTVIALTSVCGALGLAAPALAAAAPHTTAAVPVGFQPASTSWLTPQRGMVIGYTSTTPGAHPTLLGTSNGGSSWTQLGAPPITSPANHNTVQVTWADPADAFVTDGTRIAATHDGAKHWGAVTLSGAAKGSFVTSIRVFGHRVFALVYPSNQTSVSVFSGAEDATSLSAVAGLTVAAGQGGIAYGSLAATGGLQVALGANYTTRKYWVATDGTHFKTAPAPCPDTQVASLAGVLAGKPVALCSGSPSDVGPGQNEKRVWVAPRLGAAFAASGMTSDSPNTDGFAAVSASDATIVTTFSLLVTFDGGKTWAPRIPQPNGAFWSDLGFPSAATGYVVGQTVTNAGSFTSTLYRTSNGGHTWAALRIK